MLLPLRPVEGIVRVFARLGNKNDVGISASAMFQLAQIEAFIDALGYSIGVVVEQSRSGHMFKVVVVQDSKTHAFQSAIEARR